jgi:phytoene dehydrogenase-like protein
MIDRFFRPFFGGVFLDRQLVTSSRLFRFLYRTFAEGETAVPARGMGAIPEQLAEPLPAESIRLNSPVESAEPGRVALRGGEVLSARAVVVATDGPAAARLLGGRIEAPKSRSVCGLYFAADESPLKEPIVVLDGDGRGPVNHLAVLSDVAPSYAPPGSALISASVLGAPPQDDVALEAAVRDQLTDWFGPAVRRWRHLRTYRIAHALPDQTAPALDVPERPVMLADGLYVCGDHRDNASINGAMASGFRAAQAVAAELSK